MIAPFPQRFVFWGEIVPHISREDTRPLKLFKVPVWALRRVTAIAHVLAKDQEEADFLARDLAVIELTASRWKSGEIVNRPRAIGTESVVAQAIERRIAVLDAEIEEYGGKTRSYVEKDRFWLAATHSIQRVIAEGRRHELQVLIDLLTAEYGGLIVRDDVSGEAVPDEEAPAKE
jgi:hypothetical protein